jgi:DNA-binding PadR family transcriptional regulator
MPVSKYHLVTKVTGIRQQRPDRVNFIMDTLERNGFISSTKTPNANFYQITPKGIEAYSKWIKDFLDFARFSSGNDL